MLHYNIPLYKLHYNVLQHIRTFYKTLQDIPTYSSCQPKRSNRLFRWISGPAVLSVINFVLRRSPWVDKHQARPWVREKKKKDDKRILKLARCVCVCGFICFNMLQSCSIQFNHVSICVCARCKCWILPMGRCFAFGRLFS